MSYDNAILIVFRGLPGVGKTTMAKQLARELGATYLRMDSLEQGIKESALAPPDIMDAGYQAAYFVAGDNLDFGRTVIADSVNPVALTRNAWREVAEKTTSTLIEVEVVCSDRQEHKRRVETRKADIQDHQLPTWQMVCEREYELSSDGCLLLDTAKLSVSEAVSAIKATINR